MLAADHSFFSLGAARAIKERSRDHVCGVRGSRTPSALGGVHHIAIYLYISRSPRLSTYIQRAQERGREREREQHKQRKRITHAYTHARTQMYTRTSCERALSPRVCMTTSCHQALATTRHLRLTLRIRASVCDCVAWRGKGAHICAS